MKDFSKKHTAVLICLIILIATLAVYWQVRLHDFVSFDDGRYVYENPHVRTGISLDNIAWAFGFTGIAYWHPLTWLSHMLDCQLFGLNPGWHHVTNLIFHLINSLLLLLVLWKMTGELWKSAVIALLFALHPINVESVAWAAQRKNILSTLFYLLTLLGYSFYTAGPQIRRYLLVLLLFALGLLAKPAIVTLPFVLLLLDFWPLNRMHIDALAPRDRALVWVDIKAWLAKSNIFRLILEKVPFFFLSAVSIYLSFLSSQHHDIVISAHEVPAGLRLANSLLSFMAYIGKLIWPHKLAVFYPYPKAIPIWVTVAALIGVLSVSVIVLRWAIRLPYLLVGWFWFLGILVPHSGLMQAGLWPAFADRWAYIPYIGLFMMSVWGIPHLFADRRYVRFGLPLVTGIIVSVLAIMTWTQTGYWKNNLTLYQRAIDVTRNNDVAHNNLGVAYFDAGMVDRAIYHFAEALRIRPGHLVTYRNLNRALASREKGASPIEGMRKLLKIYPEHPGMHFNLGNLYRSSGQLDQALYHFREALVYQPDFIHAMKNMAGIYIVRTDYSNALILMKQIAALQPDDPEICVDIARVYAIQRQATESITWLERAIEKGLSNRAGLQTDRQLRLLNDSAEFQAFLNKIEEY